MKAKSIRTLLLLLILGYFGHAIGGTTPTEETVSTEETKEETKEETDKETEEEQSEENMSAEADALVGNSEAGEVRYNESCVNCHGAAGKGAASYPKISGNEISYTKEKLETYRDGIKIGPNSSLMIMMAKPLTDEEIANLAAYLKDAT